MMLITQKLIWIILGLLIFSNSIYAANSIHPKCKAHELNSPEVKGRGKAVIFPDGRVIEVVGHIHGERPIYQILDDNNSGRLHKMSNAEFSAYFRKILAESRSTKTADAIGLRGASVWSHALSDLGYLQKKLGDDPKHSVQFIGWEGSQENWENNAPNFISLRNIILREFDLHRLRDDLNLSLQELEEALLVSMNANSYLYVVQPNLSRNIPMVGPEDSVAGESHEKGDALKQMEDAMKKLKREDNKHWKRRPAKELEALKDDSVAIKTLSDIMNLYNDVTLMRIISLGELEQRLSPLRTNKFPWLRSSLARLEETFKLRIRLNLERDEASARSLASINRSGIHFVGLNHLASLIANLERLCTAETSQSAILQVGAAPSTGAR